MARGKSRSNTIENVLNQAKQIAASGVKEIVLTGVNLGDFGAYTPAFEQASYNEPHQKEDFLQLITKLDAIEGIERFRISSIEPNLLNQDIIRFVAGSKKFMPHFHIPLQSGSNKILGLMRRRYKKELYAERVEMIKSLMPHCAIGVDVIVGFPGENDAEFEETYQFLHQLDVSYLHVFTYSERDSTKALEIKPVVPIQKRNQRNKQLRNLSFMKMRYFTEQHAGQKRWVLFEQHDKEGMMEGYTDNYIKISTPTRPEWKNQLVEWNL
jgi:threonylcarbamoyladenosine tRNA methylthiotransferase MtaB